MSGGLEQGDGAGASLQRARGRYSFPLERGRVFKKKIKMTRSSRARTSEVRPIISAAFRRPSSVQIFATMRPGPRRDPRPTPPPRPRPATRAARTTCRLFASNESFPPTPPA